MTINAYLQGRITGNGPADRQKRAAWEMAGYRPNQFKFGQLWFDYSSFEPFNQIMTIVADIGDASQLMGSEWTEKEFQKISIVVAQGLTSKSYLAGMSQFVDLFAGKEGQFNRIIAGIMNNQLPLSSIRNDLGKVFTPYTRELNSGIADALRNRNKLFEYGPGEDLPIKYDLLNGKPINDWDPITRMVQAFLPISMNLDYHPGREFLFRSGYDLRMSVMASPGPNSIDLSKNARFRSKFSEAIGLLYLE